MSYIFCLLEAKARAATRGKWVTGQDGHLRGAVNCGKKHIAMANFFHSRDEEQRVLNTEDNADYISAASPDVMLALIAELRKCEAMCEIITEQGARIERCLKMVQKMAGLNGLKIN